MSLDTDECYIAQDLAAAKSCMLEHDYEGVLCKMRYYFKDPCFELLPPDDLNWVPALYKLSENMPFRLGCPYPFLLDPTRRLHGLRRLHVLDRFQLEMHHFSFVRKDGCRSKILNVSNRSSYSEEASLSNFIDHFDQFSPPTQAPHPHPYFGNHFTHSRKVPNMFGICWPPH